jgi:F0F1-type ATP synthase, epsilon subunit (mitochondrial delta subunit)
MADETTTPVTAETEQPAVNTGGKLTMSVKVYAPFKVYFEGEAYSISAVNAIGPFDILPRHHNFLCMLVPCTIKVKGLDGEKLIKAHRALMHVKADSVVVFMDV